MITSLRAYSQPPQPLSAAKRAIFDPLINPKAPPIVGAIMKTENARVRVSSSNKSDIIVGATQLF